MSNANPDPSRGTPAASAGPASGLLRAGGSSLASGWHEPEPQAADHDRPAPWGTNRVASPPADGEIADASLTERLSRLIAENGGQ